LEVLVTVSAAVVVVERVVRVEVEER